MRYVVAELVLSRTMMFAAIRSPIPPSSSSLSSLYIHIKKHFPPCITILPTPITCSTPIKYSTSGSLKNHSHRKSTITPTGAAIGTTPSYLTCAYVCVCVHCVCVCAEEDERECVLEHQNTPRSPQKLPAKFNAEQPHPAPIKSYFSSKLQ